MSLIGPADKKPTKLKFQIFENLQIKNLNLDQIRNFETLQDETQKRRFVSLIGEFRDIFVRRSGRTSLYEHELIEKK